MYAIAWKETGARDSLSRALQAYAPACTIYFGIYNLEPLDADHIAHVRQTKDGYRYDIAGHGLSPRTTMLANLDDLLLRVLADNRFFNMTDTLYVASA